MTPENRFGVVIADPPWSFNDKLTMSDVARGADANYPTLDVEAIRSMRVSAIAAPDAVLALWVPGSLLDVGIDVVKAWGFSTKQVFVWSKTTKNGLPAFGMGRLFRQSHEIALVGTRGKPYGALKSRSERSVCVAPNLGHSIKPDHLHESLERMFPEAHKLELFARRKRPGWTCLGNEIDGQDIRAALAVLEVTP